MASLAVLRVALTELFTKDRVPRRTEPDLVMDDPDKVAAYTRAGREDGVMAPVYLFHSAQMSEIIRPGDRILDLACGPATQLAMVARLNPHSQFTGIDLSPPMLARAQEHIAEQELTNVSFVRGDITDLAMFESGSFDAVVSSMALHHLPTVSHLERAFAEVRRVLKSGGGLYLVDFGRLKSEKSIEYFAHQYADRQPELFTLDYLYSLQAAFEWRDFAGAAEVLEEAGRLYHTFVFPFMVALKSPARRSADEALKMKLLELKRQLPPHHRRDFGDLVTFFRLGGLQTPFGLA